MIKSNRPTRRARVYSCKLNRRKISNLASYRPGIDPKGTTNFTPSSLFGQVLKNIKYSALSNGEKVVVCFKGCSKMLQGKKLEHNKLYLKAHSPIKTLYFDASKIDLSAVEDQDGDVQTS